MSLKWLGYRLNNRCSFPDKGRDIINGSKTTRDRSQFRGRKAWRNTSFGVKRPVQTRSILCSFCSTSLTLKRPPGVKFDPSLRFFRQLFWCILQWHKPSWLCHDKFPLGPHSGYVLLVIAVFLKFRFFLHGVRFDPRWPCACCFSIFSFVHFCGDNVL